VRGSTKPWVSPARPESGPPLKNTLDCAKPLAQKIGPGFGGCEST